MPIPFLSDISAQSGTFAGSITADGVVTVGPGTTGSPYDSTTFLHIKGTTRSIVQQSSTADAYYMFGDAAANNVGWIGYNHSTGNANIQAESTITLYKPTDIVGTLGVGIGSPQEKLHVYNAGTARVEVEGTTGPAAFKATNNQGSFGWYVPSDANNFRLWNFGTSADLVTIDASGNTTFAGSVTATDYRSSSHIYLTSGDSWIFRSIAGTERARIKSNGFLGIGTNNPDEKLHVMYQHADGAPTTYARAIIEDTDAQLDLLSTSSGTWGSAINFVEAAGSGANTDVWSIARKTTGGVGDSSLNFNFGTNNQHSNTNRVSFSSTGGATFAGNVLPATDGVQTLGSSSNRWGALELKSGGQIQWQNGDARIIEGLVNNYSLSFQTYDSSNTTLSTALRLDGNNLATFAGNVNVPSGYVGRDTHNGIYFSTDDQIIIRVADTHRVKLNADGLLPYADSSYDLGTSSLYWKDAYIDTITTTGAITSNLANGKWRINSYGAMYFRNSSNATHESYIHSRSDGSLSIGRVAESNWTGSGAGAYAAATYDHLTFDTSSNATFAGHVDAGGRVASLAGSSQVQLTEYSNGATIWLDGSNGDLIGADYFGIHAYGTTDLAFSYGATTKITMKNDGKLGIGTDSPSEPLDVVGTARMDNAIVEGTLYAGDSVQHWGDGGPGVYFSTDTVQIKTASAVRGTFNNYGFAGDLDGEASLFSGYSVNHQYEGNPQIDHEVFNAYAGAHKWATISLTNVFQSNRTTAFPVASFDQSFLKGGNTDQVYFNASEDEMVIEIDHSSDPIKYTSFFGIQFTHVAWRANRVKIEVYVGSSWNTLIDTTTNTQAQVYGYHGSGGTGTSKVKFTLGDPESTNKYLRISKIFAQDYKGFSAADAEKRGDYSIEKYEDSSHFNNIYPAQDGVYNLGTSTKRYNQIYSEDLTLINAGPVLTMQSTNNASGGRINVTGLDQDNDDLLRIQDNGTTRLEIHRDGSIQTIGTIVPNVTFSGSITAGGDITATGADFTLAHAAGATMFIRRDDTSISDGDVIGLLNFQGDDPSDGTFNTGVAIKAVADGTWQSGKYPGELLFQTRADSASSSLTTALTLGSDQNATFAGHVLPAADSTYNLGSDTIRWASIYADSISALSNISIGGALNLNSNIAVLNKAQTAYINLATRDTGGSEVVYNLSNIGTGTFAGNVNAGSYQVSGTTRIDSGGKFFPTSINGTGKISFLNGSSAQGARVSSLYAGTTYANDGSAAGTVDVLNGYRVQGTTVIDSNRNIIGNGNLFLRSYNTSGQGIFFRDGFEHGDGNEYNLSITILNDTDGSADALEINAYDGIYFNTGSNSQNIRAKIDSAGLATFYNDVTVLGNLIVDGTTTTLNTQTVEVEDNILQLNTTQGTPDTATAATSGISVYRGNGVTQASFIFDDGDDTWDLTNKLNVAGDITTSGNIILSGAANEIIKSNGSIRLNIDSDNNQGDRVFIVSHHSNTELFRVDEGGHGTFQGNVKVGNALIDSNSTTSATTTTTAASVAVATYGAAFFDYVAFKGSNIRAGTIAACNDGTNVSFAETSTTDLGDTSDVTFAVDISGGNMRLRATTASSTWTIKVLIRGI